MAQKDGALIKIETEIKLQINKRLYGEGHITGEIYAKARQMILAGRYGLI